MSLRSKLLIIPCLLLSAVFFVFTNYSSAEVCGNRNLIGYSDIFWGNPPPINVNQLSPRSYNDVNAGPGDIVRLSVEGEFPDFTPTTPPDCSGLPVEFQIYLDGSITPVVRVSGSLSSGSQIAVGNFGSWQWQVDWIHNLPDGSYRFKVVRLGGTSFNSALSTNLLIITGAGPPPPPMVCSINPSPSSGNPPLNSVDMGLAVTSGWMNASRWRVDCTDDGVFDEPWFQVTTVPNYTWVDVCSYPSPGVYTVRGRVEEQGSGTTRVTECTTQVNVIPPPPTATISCNGSSSCNITYNSPANLTWSSTNATSCSVSPGGWTGTSSSSQSTGNLTSTTTYTLSCTGAGGSTSASTTVNVSAPTLAVNLSATPNSGLVPLSVNLTANVSGNSTGTINYSFWWNCSNSTTSVATAESACGTLPSPSLGSCASNASGAKCNAYPNSSVTQSNVYSSAGTYTPKVIAERGTASPVQAQTSVMATNPLPTADIQCNGLNSCSVAYNSPATLSWTSTNATSCSVSPGGWTGTSNSNQSTGNLVSTTIYTLTCTGVGGSISDSATVTVALPPPPVLNIDCNGSISCSIAYNSPATINWSSTNTTSCSVSPGGWTGISGSQSTGNLLAPTIYVLSCSSAVGQVSNSVTVDVAPPPPVPQTIPTTFNGILSIVNPFSGQINTFDDLLKAIINFLYYLVGPVVVIMIIASGLMFLFGRGEPNKVSTAKRILLWAVVGLAIILIGRGFIELLKSIIALGN